jgi:hypothetical protein
MKLLFGILTAVSILASASSVNASSDDHKSPTFGDGVAAYSLLNYEKAAEIWQSLAENGSADAAFRLAQLYDIGLGVEYSPDEVTKWLSLASERGHVSAQYMLAEIYSSGKGIEVDPPKAFNLYLKAAKKHHPQAMYKLAGVYFLGQGVAKDTVSSAYWFARSIEKLSVPSQRATALGLYNTIFAKLSDVDKLVLLKRLASQ